MATIGYKMIMQICNYTCTTCTQLGKRQVHKWFNTWPQDGCEWYRELLSMDTMSYRVSCVASIASSPGSPLRASNYCEWWPLNPVKLSGGRAWYATPFYFTFCCIQKITSSTTSRVRFCDESEFKTMETYTRCPWAAEWTGVLFQDSEPWTLQEVYTWKVRVIAGWLPRTRSQNAVDSSLATVERILGNG